MRKRTKQSIWRQCYWRVRIALSDLRHSRRNAEAAYSAWYMLMDLNSPEGIERLAELTGLPEGTVAAGMKNIFGEGEL